MRYYKFSAAERKLIVAEAELPEPGPGGRGQQRQRSGYVDPLLCECR